VTAKTSPDRAETTAFDLTELVDIGRAVAGCFHRIGPLRQRSRLPLSAHGGTSEWNCGTHPCTISMTGHAACGSGFR